MIELLLIVSLAAIIIALVSLNSTESKFQSAIRLLNQKKHYKAKKILQEIFHKHPEAISKYAEILYIQGNAFSSHSIDQALRFYNEVIECEKLLNLKDNRESFHTHLVSSQYEIASIFLSQAQKNGNNEESALLENLKYIGSVPKQGREADFQNLIDQHYFRLSIIDYDKGVEYEKKKIYLKAIEYYHKSSIKLNSAANLDNNLNAIFRAEISRLKNGQTVNFYDIDQIEDKTHPFRSDLLYRYSIHLLINNGDYQEAESILDSLPNNEETLKLRTLCTNERIKLAIQRVSELNLKIKDIYTKDFSDEVFTEFYDSLRSYSKEYREFIPELSDQLDKLKPSIFNRILHNCYKERKFGKALNLLVKVPQFYDSPIILKNIGNACLYYIQNEDISAKNYELIISLFLTSAFSDSVFIHSLSETEWDDEYTFTLIDSIGSNFQLHNSLPDNVNYEEVNSTNISIGLAQKELLSQFELLLISKVTDQKVLEKIQSFFDAEKEALEEVIKHIKKELIIPAPFLAEKYKLQGEIIKALENEYDLTNEEVYLQAGMPYCKLKIDGPIRDYKETAKTLDCIIESIRKEDKDGLERKITNEFRKKIGKYKQLMQIAEERIMKALQMRIDKDDYNESLIPLFNKAISLSSDFDNLKYQYANFVINLCIAKVNADKMSITNALKLVIRVYQIQSDNPRVCKNLATLVKMNLFDVINDEINSPSAVFKEIDRITQNLSETFIQNATELRQAREEFLGRLTSENRIAILTGYNLSKDGEKAKRALEYMGELSGSEAINDPLATLRSSFGL